MIEKYPHKYAVMDDCGYTDADLVTKLNETIDVVNKLLEENEELKRQISFLTQSVHNETYSLRRKLK